MLKLRSTLLLLLSPVTGAGQALIDTHLHYNAEHAERFAPTEVLAILREAGAQRAVVTGRPPEQALVLYTKAPELIIPLLGVYRTASDKAHWTEDAALPGRVEQQLATGPWRGLGELHLFAAQRHNPVFLRLVEIAARNELPLLMHCDPVVIDRLFDHAPDATVIWAHAGAYPYPPLLRDYLARYPQLHLDLSVRDERIAPDGELLPEWEELLLEYPDRFLVGVDTYRTERWGEYDRVATQIRGWLEDLPGDVAVAVARQNAIRLFGPPPSR